MNACVPYLDRECDLSARPGKPNADAKRAGADHVAGKNRAEDVVYRLRKIKGSWEMKSGTTFSAEPPPEESAGDFRRIYIHKVLKDADAAEYKLFFSYMQEKRQPKKLHGKDLVANIVSTFVILPADSRQRYFKKAGLHSSSTEALQSDWEKVGKDLWSAVFSSLPKLAKINER